MEDLPSVLIVKDGIATTRNIGTLVDDAGTQYPQHVMRANGAPVTTAAPLPVADAAGNAALGAPADTAWASGAGSVVALLKTLAGYLASLVTNTTGGATGAGQTTANTALTAIAASTAAGATAANQTAGNTNTAASATSLAALVSGGATAARQDTGNTSAAAIVTALAGTLAVRQVGSSGLDRSANAPAGPGAATSFSFNGVTVNLLTTIAANTARRCVEVNNTTGSFAVVVIDDGANTTGTISMFPLAAGTAQYTQGGDFVPQNEFGRIRVFGATGTFLYARET